jgi:glycosyltransferase involved in cell wall biosynthesis
MKFTLVGTFPPFRGGIAHFNVTLAKALSENHEVLAINFTTQYPQRLFPGKTQYEEDSQPLPFSNKTLLSSINPRSWSRTGQAIVEFSPDVIIFKYWLPFFAPAFSRVVRYVKKRITAQVLVICDNVIPHEKRPFDLQLTRYFFDVVDHFIVMSQAVERDLIKLYPQASYRYTPHPVYNLFGTPLKQEVAREQLGIKTGKVILFFGLIRAYKGLDILLKTTAELKGRLEDFTVVVAGECYENPEVYTSLVSSLSIGDVCDLRMRFIPNEEVKTYFSAADVVVLPYKSATQSGIVPIAYHFNCPVIVSNVGGLPEIVLHGEVGYVVKPSVADFRHAILQFYSEGKSKSFREEIKRYKKRFSWEAMVATIEEVVQR